MSRTERNDVFKRAEDVLLEIAYSLQNIQQQGYKTEELLTDEAKKVQQQQTKILYKRPVIESLALALSGATYVYSLYATSKIPQPDFKVETQVKAYESSKRDVHDAQARNIDIIGRVSSFATSFFVDPPNTATQAETQRVERSLQEYSTLHSSLQSIGQTTETILQRIQGIKTNAQQAG